MDVTRTPDVPDPGGDAVRGFLGCAWSCFWLGAMVWNFIDWGFGWWTVGILVVWIGGAVLERRSVRPPARGR